MRHRRIGVVRRRGLVVGAVVVLARVALAQADPVAVWLEIGSDLGGTAEPAPSLGAMLLLNGLAARERNELSLGLARLADSLERRKNPLYTPLDDEELREEMVSLLARTRPARTAAVAFAAGRWRTADGDLAARAVARCPPDSRCRLLVADDPGDGLARRLRFLLWPLGAALLVQGRDGAEAASIADRLRAGEGDDSRIALVLGATDLHRRRHDHGTAGLARVAARVAKVAKAVKTAPPELVELLEGIADRQGGDEITWLRLPPNAVLVVPRLGALATPDALLAEVHGRLSGRDATIGSLAFGVAVP